MKLKQSLQALLLLLLFSCALHAAEPQQVVIKKFKFIPQEITIAQGETVQWVNQEKRQYHSVFFEQEGLEESEYLFPDDRWQRTFTRPGSYPYRCGPHPKMVGIVHVQ